MKFESHKIATLLFILLLISPLSVGAEGKALLSINLLQLSNQSENESNAKATHYLKRLIEQRTSQRITVTIYPGPTEQIATDNVLIAVAGNQQQGEEIAQRLNTKMQRFDVNADTRYQILISIDYQMQMSSELRIILEGALKDSLAYLSELEGNT